MRDNRLCVHPAATFAQAGLFLTLVIGALASGAAATNAAPTNPARAAQVHVAIVAKGDVASMPACAAAAPAPIPSTESST
jgi:hypothetical protein